MCELALPGGVYLALKFADIGPVVLGRREDQDSAELFKSVGSSERKALVFDTSRGIDQYFLRGDLQGWRREEREVTKLKNSRVKSRLSLIATTPQWYRANFGQRQPCQADSFCMLEIWDPSILRSTLPHINASTTILYVKCRLSKLPLPTIAWRLTLDSAVWTSRLIRRGKLSSATSSCPYAGQGKSKRCILGAQTTY